MEYAELKEDRLNVRDDKKQRALFLRKGVYEVVRNIKGLGKLVKIGGKNSKPILTIIKEDK